MTELRFRQVETTADTGLLVWGRDEKELLENAAVGLFSVLARRKGVRNVVERTVTAVGDDDSGRLVSWLSEWLYLFDTEGFIGRSFLVEGVGKGRVTGRGWGDIHDPQTHELRCGVKGITYHGISVRRVRGRLRTRVVLDV